MFSIHGGPMPSALSCERVATDNVAGVVDGDTAR